MKTQVEFRSDRFPAYPDEEQQLNPGVWGRRLAEFVAERLAAAGISCGEPNAEDWGWYLPVTIDDVRLAVCCGHQDGDDDEFVIFTDPSTPIMRRGFKKVDVTPQLERLTLALDDLLTSDPTIGDIAWIHD
jgi:hypothetical protein